MKKRILAVLIAVIVLLVAAVPAAAITDGELDGDGHPHVVLIIMDVGGEPTYRCSGTMLSPTVVLTAGHCTSNYPDAPYTGLRIFTESDVQNGNNTYPDPGGPNSVEAAAWYAHPDYETGPFYMNDVGIIILESPGFDPGVFGVLPTEAGQFDDLKSGHKNGAYFTSVGYGLQESFPDQSSYDAHNEKIRMVAEPFLLNINAPGMTGDFAMLLSNNYVTGGTCYGDSGGPNFIQDTNLVAGITSFGMNIHCAGTGGVFRTDQQDLLDFVTPFLQ